MTAKATRREWIGLAVLALPCLIYSMDLTVLYLAIPHISADLGPNATELLWIMDIYGFLIAGSLMTMGTLGDRIGRRKLLLIGAAAFGGASVLAALAASPGQLIAARALQGLAGAALAPSTLSLIRNMFHDEQERGRAVGIWVASFSAGGIIGPLIGGVILTHGDWEAIFLINVPIMLLLLVLGPLLLPEYRDPNASRLDPVSALLSMAAVLAVIYGLKQVAAYGLQALPLLMLAGGIGIGMVFLRQQRRHADPLIDLRLFAVPAFTGALTLNLLALFIAFGFFVLIAQYLQLVLGMNAIEAGLWTVPSGIVFVAGSMIGPVLSRRFRLANILACGMLIAAAGMVLLALSGPNTPFALFFAGYMLFCIGLSPIGALTSHLVVSAAPPEKAGSASALSETSFELGGALGVALIGSLATASYRASMGASTLPDALSTAQQTSSIDTLAGAVTSAGQIAGPAAIELLELSRTAFTQAMNLSAAVCVVIAVMAGFLAWRRL